MSDDPQRPGVGADGDGDSASPVPTAPATVIVDEVDAEPLAPPPSTGGDDELRAAVGVPARPAPGKAKPPRPPRDDDDDDRDADRAPRKRGHVAMWAGVFLLAALGVGTLVLLGHLNADRYVIACAPDEIRAERGRGFPPWGARELSGAEWRAIAIPADAECKPRETDTEDELAGWFLDLLVERAEKALLARDPLQAEVAAAQLQQALLLARAPERRDQRRAVERLLGDVEYWRAAGKLAAARTALLDAAKQFDAAAAQVPRHVTDASAWARFVRQVSDELQAGPGGVRAPLPGERATLPERPTAPPGVALPVEPTAPGSALPMPPPDAGVPSGGVLL